MKEQPRVKKAARAHVVSWSKSTLSGRVPIPPGSGFRRVYDPRTGRCRAFVSSRLGRSNTEEQLMPSWRGEMMQQRELRLQRQQQEAQGERDGEMVRLANSSTIREADENGREERPTDASSGSEDGSSDAADNAAAPTVATIPASICQAAIGGILHAQRCPGCLDQRCVKARQILGAFRRHAQSCTKLGHCAQCSIIAQTSELVQQANVAAKLVGGFVVSPLVPSTSSSGALSPRLTSSLASLSCA